jgi:hypothetical protein
MAANEELTSFVREALGRGLPRDRIRGVLSEASWSDDQVSSALASFAEVEFPLAVPRPRPSVSAKEAFEYLVLFGTLYVSAVGLGNLLFQLVNLAFPDPLWPQEMFLRIAGAVRWAIASLVVAAPIFVFVARVNARAVAASPLKRTSPVRQWLTYLTLAVAAAVLIGDGTRLVYSLLAGELTTRFVLKVLTIGVIAGTAFLYYLRDLRRDETEVRS